MIPHVLSKSTGRENMSLGFCDLRAKHGAIHGG